MGDSSAVIAELDSGGQPKQPGRYLTADHRLTNPEERDRLQGLGITLGHGGTRLYGLNLGRCLGDRYLKVRSAVQHLDEPCSDVTVSSSSCHHAGPQGHEAVWPQFGTLPRGPLPQGATLLPCAALSAWHWWSQVSSSTVDRGRLLVSWSAPEAPHALRNTPCCCCFSCCCFCMRVPAEQSACSQLSPQVSLQGLHLPLEQQSKRLCMQVEDLGLSASPHWSPVERFDPAQQMLVIIASDGVWDVASAQRIVQV